MVFTPNAQYMQRPKTFGMVERTAKRLAVDGDACILEVFSQRRDPSQATLLEGLWVEQLKHATKGVVRRDAAGQLQKLSEEILLVLGEFFDFREGFTVGQHATKGHHDNVDQLVLLVVIPPWIRQILEVLDDRGNVDLPWFRLPIPQF